MTGKALSDKDLTALLGKSARIAVYPDLHKFHSLDDLMGSGGACCLLFESRPNYGHWTAVLRTVDSHGSPVVEFFDPYGTTSSGGHPDDSLRLIDPAFAAVSSQDFPYLSALMMNSPYELSYNQYAFQEKDPNIKTCGRHCAVRLLMRGYSLDHYVEWLADLAKKYGRTADELVTAMTG